MKFGGSSVADLAAMRRCIAIIKNTPMPQVVVVSALAGVTRKLMTLTYPETSPQEQQNIFRELRIQHEAIFWTDVKGIFSSDPKLYKAAQPIAHLSFGEALELATFGAKVLHPRTLEPAIRNKIRCFVGSSLEPDGGTWIDAGNQGTTPKVKAITLKKEQMLLHLERSYKTATLNFLENFLEILNQHDIDFDLISNHGLSTTLVLDDSLANWHHKSLLSDALIQQLTALGKIKITKGLTLLALVGQDIPQCPNIKRLLSAFLEDKVVNAFYYGTSPYSLCVLTTMAAEKIERDIAHLHQQLIG
jgi:aspartate kinase